MLPGDRRRKIFYKGDRGINNHKEHKGLSQRAQRSKAICGNLRNLRETIPQRTQSVSQRAQKPLNLQEKM